MNWRLVNKWERFHHQEYYLGRKKGCIINIQIKRFRGKWVFSVQREKDDFIFNSGWESHTNPLYKKFIQELDDTSKFTIDDIQNYVEAWVDKNVPILKK